MATIESIKNASESDSTKISVCDIMKNNTSAVIQKMETQVPTYVQLYSDLYTNYLDMFDDLFGTCYISEKQFFDKMGIDQKTLNNFNNYSKTISENYCAQIDMSTKFLQSYVQMRISTIKSFEDSMHVMMDNYAHMLSQFNNFFKTKK